MKYWKRLLWGLVAAVCLIAALLLLRGDRKTIRELTPQLAAESFQTKEKPYAMASVFLPESEAIPQSSLGEIRLSVEKSLTDSGVGSDTHPWLYSASYQTNASLTYENAQSEVLLTAVTGDYFRIHPMQVLSGWYMDESDLMHDRVVLSRQAAWELFASDNVVGMLLELNGIYYQVAAVVEPEQGTFNEMAAGDTPRAWVFADSPALAERVSGPAEEPEEGQDAPLPVEPETDTVPGFTCMEMVLPQPVKGFAVSAMKNALKGVISEQTEITDNSGRFSLGSRLGVLKSLSVRGISQDAVEYPYYENAARLTENHLAIRLVPEGLLMCVPILSLLVLLILLNRKRTWGLHSIREAVENAIDRKRQRDYYGTTEPQEDWEEDWDPEREEDDLLPYGDEDDSYDDGEDNYSDYDDDEPDEPYEADFEEDAGEEDGTFADSSEDPEPRVSPPKSKKERRRERRVRRRRAKRRRKAQRLARKSR